MTARIVATKTRAVSRNPEILEVVLLCSKSKSLIIGWLRSVIDWLTDCFVGCVPATGN